MHIGIPLITKRCHRSVPLLSTLDTHRLLRQAVLARGLLPSKYLTIPHNNMSASEASGMTWSHQKIKPFLRHSIPPFILLPSIPPFRNVTALAPNLPTAECLARICEIPAIHWIVQPYQSIFHDYWSIAPPSPVPIRSNLYSMFLLLRRPVKLAGVTGRWRAIAGPTLALPCVHHISSPN